MHQVVRATRAGLLKLGFPEILGNLYDSVSKVIYCDVLLFFQQHLNCLKRHNKQF